jgi:hypothetical protein
MKLFFHGLAPAEEVAPRIWPYVLAHTLLLGALAVHLFIAAVSSKPHGMILRWPRLAPRTSIATEA